MKILMVSMPSLHFFRWTEQLKDSGHEVYWFDITDGGKEVERINWVHQITGWKLKFNYPGRYFIKNRVPSLYRFIQKFNENNIAEVFEEKLRETQPDAVHSFALYVSCTPILEVMKRHTYVKWIYSSWGSDLFYYQNHDSYLKDIKNVLPSIDYLFTDCKRDYAIAQKYGFNGTFLGIFPGGGGFDLEAMHKFSIPFDQRKTILVKGFQGRSGRAITVLKAIFELEEQLQNFEIIVFGADKEVFEFSEEIFKHWKNFKITGKLPHQEILKLMGRSMLYIGNSNSDGMPNTLLEAFCMNAFPIQSNPGGATEEIITNGKNGFLIDDCEDEIVIKELILKAILKNDKTDAVASNFSFAVKNLDYDRVRQSVLEAYATIA